MKAIIQLQLQPKLVRRRARNDHILHLPGIHAVDPHLRSLGDPIDVRQIRVEVTVSAKRLVLVTDEKKSAAKEKDCDCD